MKRRLLRMAACLLLCLAALPLSASADTGPKPAVSITVVNAPEGAYYLDLLITGPGDYPNVNVEDYDPALLEGLKSWEDEGWWPALVEGTNVPLFGDLVPGEDGTHRFSYHGLPDTFRIAVSGPDGAQATEEPFTRQVFYTHLTYDWQTNSITRATSPAGFYAAQFLSTLLPTLLVEGLLLFAFGFRARRDWLVFLLTNLATQAGLYALVGTQMVSTGSSLLHYFALFFLEIPIWLAELLVYIFLLKEHGRGRRALYALCANAASYMVGFFPLHFVVDILAA